MIRNNAEECQIVGIMIERKISRTMDWTTNCTNIRTYTKLMSDYLLPSIFMPSHHLLYPRTLRSKIENNEEEIYKSQAATLLMHHKQSQSLERKRLDGVLTDAHEG